MPPLRAPTSRRGETPVHPIAPRPTGCGRPSEGPAVNADRRFPIRRTRPQPARSVRTAATPRSIKLPRIVEHPPVQVSRRADQAGVDLRQHTIELHGVAFLVPDRAPRNAVAIASA